MLTTAEAIIDNLNAVLLKHGMKPAHFADLAESKGFDLNRTFISRLLSKRSANISLQKLDAIAQALILIEPDMTVAKLVTPGSMTNTVKQPLSQQQLSDFIYGLVFDLTDLDWVTVKPDLPKKVVSDYIGLSLKKLLANDAESPQALSANKK